MCTKLCKEYRLIIFRVLLMCILYFFLNATCTNQLQFNSFLFNQSIFYLRNKYFHKSSFYLSKRALHQSSLYLKHIIFIKSIHLPLHLSSRKLTKTSLSIQLKVNKEIFLQSTQVLFKLRCCNRSGFSYTRSF